MRVISRKALSVINGTRRARLGVSSSACSATSRCTASRTGMTLTPSALAVVRSEICSPGIIWPVISSSLSWA